MKQIKCILFVILVYFLSPSLQNVRHGERPEYLHVYSGDDEGELQKPKSIVLNGEDASDYLLRIKRSNSASAKEKRDTNESSKKNSDGELAKLSTTMNKSGSEASMSSSLPSSTSSPTSVAATPSETNSTTPTSPYNTVHEVNTYGNITVMVSL